MIQKFIAQFSKAMNFKVPLDIKDFKHMWDLVEKNDEPIFDYRITDWRTLRKEAGQYLSIGNADSIRSHGMIRH